MAIDCCFKLTKMVILAIATLNPKPQHLDEVCKIMDDLVVETNKEPGCLEYNYYISRDKKIVFIEQWKDEAAVEYHRNTPHMKGVNARLKGKMAGPISGRSVKIAAKI